MVTTRSSKRKKAEAKPSKAAKRSKQVIKDVKKPKKSSPKASLDTITINRAPVLALWVSVVAERQGFNASEAATFGKWVSGTLAQSKGRSLGIFEAKERTEEEKQARKRQYERLGVHHVESFGMKIPVIEQKDGSNIAVSSQGKPLSPVAAQTHLEHAFGENLSTVKECMRELAESIPPEQLGHKAYHLYEQFRPPFKGWGVKSLLDLNIIRSLVGSWQES